MLSGGADALQETENFGQALAPRPGGAPCFFLFLLRSSEFGFFFSVAYFSTFFSRGLLS
jgi:hypothetical protein